MRELIEKIYRRAQAIGACSLFTGKETLEELVSLMFRPQGIEFMLQHKFPDLDTLREFKPYHPERFGVYIDCGEIDLTEARKVFLIGNTVARLKYREIARNQVYLMCGAKAQITASGYAVVRIENDFHSDINTTATENAVILW